MATEQNPLAWVTAAMEALEAYEADYGERLPDDHELGRIDESRGSPSFRIRVGHIRTISRVLREAADGWSTWHGDESMPVPEGTIVDVEYRDGKRQFTLPAGENIDGLDRDAGPAFWRHDGQENDIVFWRHSTYPLPSPPSENAR